jgi:O-antigen/teichoic acid export membrane protein
MSETAETGLRQSRSSVAGSILAGVLGQGALVVSGLLVARILGTDDRGNLALFVLFPAVLAQIGSLGLPLATIYQISKDRPGAAGVVRAIWRIAAAQAAGLVLLHFAILAAVFWSDPHRVRDAALLTLVSVPATLAQLYGLAILQGQQRFIAFNVLRTLPAAAYAAAVLTLWLAGSGNLEHVTIAWVATSVAVGATTLFLACSRLTFRTVGRGAASLRGMLRFGLRGLLGSSSPIEVFRLDQAVVGLFLSRGALGLYVVGLAFANLPRFIAQSVGYVAYPRIASRTDEREARTELWQFFWLAVVLAGAVVIVLELTVGRLIPFFVTSKFAGAVPITRILLAGALFLSARRVLTDGANGLGRPAYGTIAEVSSWIFLVPALAVFTPLLGAKGVALALTVSAGLSFTVLLLLVLSRRGPAGWARHAGRVLLVRGAGR